MDFSKYKLGTAAAWAGETDGFWKGATTPIVNRVTYDDLDMMSFSLKGSYDDVKQFLPSLKLVHLAASLGSVSTLAGPPRTTSHVELTEEQRRLLGIPESLIRYSVGIENPEDLIHDLDSALNSL